MVKCTTEDFIWDVDTGAPIKTEYDVVTEMPNNSYYKNELS